MRGNKILIPIAGLIVIGFFIYAFNLNNQLFWDDDEWIKGNVFVHSFSYLKEIFTQNVEAGFGLNSNYYRPLLLLSFAFNYVIHGITPFGYHLISNSFHIANGVLIFLLLARFLSSRASFIASLLFLIHPVQTEAVTYISGRGDPMSVFFMLSALYVFVCREKRGNYKNVTPLHLGTEYSSKNKPEPTGESSDKLKEVNRKFEPKWGRGGHIFLSFFFFILALLSRETAILFPLFLMIFYISFLTKEKFIPLEAARARSVPLPLTGFIASIKKSFITSLPFWIISIVYFILRLTVFNFQNTLNFYAQSNIYTENLSYRLFTFGHALTDYFKIIFFSWGLHMERDLPIHTSIFQWPVWLGWSIVLGIVVFGICLYRREQRGQAKGAGLNLRQSRHWDVWFFSWAWFFVALAPVSGIIPINAIIYEHWLYLPLIGFAALAGFYLDKVLFFLKNNQKLIAYCLLLIILASYFSFFAVQSIRRNILWGKPIKFYEDILKYSPSSVRIMTNLGNLYSEKGDLVRAEDLFKRAIENPESGIFAQPHYNLANLFRDTGRIDEAIREYKKAIEIDPNFPFAYQNLAVVYINNKQDLVEGAKILERLLEIQPGNPKIYYNLGLIYLAMDSFKAAIENLELGLNLARGRDPEAEKLITELLSRIKR